uniref:Uncharacterized protein n=1 Tax=viral metagenome TaxID=1070528 RepID=A0A6C0KRD5_9ZZZZ
MNENEQSLIAIMIFVIIALILLLSLCGVKEKFL